MHLCPVCKHPYPGPVPEAQLGTCPQCPFETRHRVDARNEALCDGWSMAGRLYFGTERPCPVCTYVEVSGRQPLRWEDLSLLEHLASKYLAPDHWDEGYRWLLTGADDGRRLLRDGYAVHGEGPLRVTEEGRALVTAYQGHLADVERPSLALAHALRELDRAEVPLDDQVRDLYRSPAGTDPLYWSRGQIRQADVLLVLSLYEQDGGHLNNHGEPSSWGPITEALVAMLGDSTPKE